MLSGQVAFVTGGATGIGKEICRVLGRHGARIAIASRQAEVLTRPLRSSPRTASRCTSTPATSATPRRPAGSSPASSSGTADSTSSSTTPPATSPRRSAKISPNGFKAVVDIDLLGTFNVSKAAFDAWLGEHGGNIVNITAPFELKGAAMQSHVAAAKAGVDSLTRTCAVEWGPRRYPGQRDRARHHRWHGGSAALLRDACPAPRPGRPTRSGCTGHGADIAYLVLFLCTDAARFISGQVIAVDGAGTVDLLKIDLSSFGG